MELVPVNSTNLLSNTSFPTPLDGSALLPILILALLGQKHTPVTRSTFDDEYDYIVVGAGSAGATVAARLSEIPDVKVLLLEAGPSPPVLTEVPAIARAFAGSPIDWRYQTVPQKYTAASHIDRKLHFSMGKAIGGSSTWNGMLYVRGNQLDYNEWAADGAKGWSYDEVLRYFKKLEDYREETDASDADYHAKGGPMTVERPTYHPDVKDALFKAAQEMSIPIVNVNGKSQYGFTDFTASLRDGRRCSTGKAYLVPAENRTNLHIVSNAFVEKVLINNNNQTEGVRVRHGGSIRTVRARREVILSAGAIHTPQILILSGIGPEKHLKELKIPPVAYLPVGQNFHDHAGSFIIFTISRLIPGYIEQITNPISIARYSYNGTGPLSSTSSVNTLAFLRTDGNTSQALKPEFQLYFFEAPTVGSREQTNLRFEEFAAYFGPYSLANNVACLSQILVPKSRGTVSLNVSDPGGPPLIDPNYFADPEDLKLCVEGLKKCYEIFDTNALQEIHANPVRSSFPACRQYMGDRDQFLECHAKSFLVSIGHPVGTAKMGGPDDPLTVVDYELKVKGIHGLRVVDASVMPTIPAGNTNVPTIMIAEKAANIIKRDIRR